MVTDRRKLPVIIAFAVTFLLPIAAQAAVGQRATATLTSRAITFVRTLVKGNFDAATTDFTSQMKQAVSPATLRNIWKSVLNQVGSFQNTSDCKIVVQGGFTTVIVKANFRLRPLLIAVTFDSAQKIAGMHFAPAP